MKVALVHDYLREYGGAERVLEALHELYPNAPLYTAFVDQEALGIHWQKFADWEIHQSVITKIPLYKKLYSPLRLFASYFFEQFDLSDYDVVISSSNMYFAKAVITKSWTPHICYCHTPPRSLYGYSTMTDWKKNQIVRLGGEFINHSIRQKDFLAAQRVDHFIANSDEVKKRIAKFYRRDATVIYPPVDVSDQISPLASGQADFSNSGGKYYLYVNRLAYSKHPELAIEVANKLKLPLKIVGTGKLEDSLKEMAGETVEFLGAVNDQELQKLYSGAKALLYPVEDEDFGIVPVEAMGFGVPVIAHKSGGPKETILDGKTGIFFDELTVGDLEIAIQKFKKTEWNHKAIHKHALQFSKERFKEEIREFVKDVVVSSTYEN